LSAPPEAAPATRLARRDVTLGQVVAIALPVVLSNATVPLQGAIDTAIIGNLGDALYLAAVTLGAQAITLLLALFNFLQFGAAALGAQALGAGDQRRVVNVLARALILAGGLGLALIAAQGPVLGGLMAIFEGSAEAEQLAGTYFSIRIWAAPAELGVFALSGWFSGQGLTRRLFEMQIVISLSNIVLSLALVLGLGMDVDGVALGTLIAAWTGLGYGLWRARRRVHELSPGWRPQRRRLLDPAELGRLMRLNRDILIRTLLIVSSFTWMMRLGSLQGDVVLAANGVLMQLFHLTSYGLDGFAIAAQALVGQAAGAHDRALLRRSVVLSTVASLGLAVLLSAAIFALETPLVQLFTNVEAVRAVAHAHYFWAALLPVVGVMAFQMDGVFVGATAGPAMRNAMIVSAAAYFAVSGWLAATYGNAGVWAGAWIFLAVRGLTLAVQYPALERRVAG
jgi:MATE family multidrug resistance protein